MRTAFDHVSLRPETQFYPENNVAGDTWFNVDDVVPAKDGKSANAIFNVYFEQSKLKDFVRNRPYCNYIYRKRPRKFQMRPAIFTRQVTQAAHGFSYRLNGKP